MKKEHKFGIAVIGFIVLVIGIVTGCGKTTPTGNTSPIASASALASTVASSTSPPTSVASSASPPTPAAVTTKAKPKPPRTAAPTKSKAPAPPPPPPTTAPVAAPTTPSGCHPISDEGTCYEPGEYCRDDDHGATGVAGDGKAIICEDNDGWRWEPA